MAAYFIGKGECATRSYITVKINFGMGHRSWNFHLKSSEFGNVIFKFLKTYKNLYEIKCNNINKIEIPFKPTKLTYTE